MCYENEMPIDQWEEENGKTSYREFDGTERKDGGNEVPDLDWDWNSDWDTADRDHASHYKFLHNTIDELLYEAGATALKGMNVSMATAKEVASDAIAKAVAIAEKEYDFYECDDLASYNLNAVLIDYELGLL